MEHNFDIEIRAMVKREKRRKVWKKILSVMMCLVVFITTYALILPAITMESSTFCGIEEHIHEAACYNPETVCPIHLHTDACYEPESQLICTASTEPGHLHTEECAPVTETSLTCTLEETEGHTHTDACAPVTETSLTCTLEETEGHTHAPECSVTEQVLSCGTEESETHAHTDSCYSSVTTNLCGLAEAPAHTHSEACYTTTTIYGCGLEEIPAHVHAEECYTTITTYGCGLEEVPAHVHEETCYQRNLICTLEEDLTHQHTPECLGELICQVELHTHSLQCYSNPNADVESAAFWEKTLPDTLTGDYAQDVLAIAVSQLGYTESGSNYVVEESGTKGYTRYGAWYGIPYGDWCAMFVSFCLDYAGVEGMPLDANCPSWEAKLSELDLYRIPSEYVPKPGDIIFFDWEGDNSSDHVGLVETIDGTTVTTIEGNSGNRVARNTYELFDTTILGYGVLVQPSSPVIEEEIPDETYLDKEDTNAWVELIGDTQETVTEQTAQEEMAQNLAEETGKSRLRFGGGGAATFNLTRTTLRSTRAIGTPLDLTPYINNVAMYDSDGNIIPSGSVVTEGDLIEFKIEYTITGQQLGIMNGEVVEQITDTLTYDLPKIFQIVRDDSGNIRNSAGQIVGSYVIDSTNGKITMTFTEDYLDQNAKGMQIHGYISFFSTVTKITEEDGEHQDYKFTDKITLGVIIEEETEAQGDLKIEKQKVEVDGEEILYEIKVTSKEGTNGPITITDQMSTGLTFKEGISVKKGNDSTVRDVTFNPSSDKSSFTMTLPEMAAGESYIIRYRCTADVDLLDANMTVQNTATVTGKDSHNKELKDKVTVNHTFEMLTKTGTLNDDGTITWTITINQAKADISGWKLRDVMGNSDFTGPVTIVGSSGNVVARNVSLPYTFPNGSKDTYTITYQTEAGYSASSNTNKAILEHNGKDITVVESVTIGSPVTKTGEIGNVIQDKNGTNLLPINWTVTINTANGALPASSELMDFMEDWTSGEMYMTYEQLMAAYESIRSELLRVGSGEPKSFTATTHVPGMTNAGATTYNRNQLISNTDGSQSKVFEKFTITTNGEIPKGSVLTFTYQTYGTFENNTVTGTDFTNQFYINERFLAKETVQLKAGSVKATKSALKYYDPAVHGEQDWFWNITDWTSTEGSAQYDFNQLHDSYLAWTIELSVPLEYLGKGDIVLHEDLPEGVSVSMLKLPFQGSVPVEVLKLEDPVPGQTYTWEFELLPADQYGQWNPQGGQMVSITVEYTETRDLKITIPGVILETMSQYAELQKPNNPDIKEWYGYLYIFTQIDEDFAWTPKDGEAYVYVDSFKNQFTLMDEDKNVIDVGSQTQIITKDEREGMIKKTASTEEGNIVNYAVVLNSFKKDLIENSGTLTVHDELTYQSTDAQPLRMRLVPGSVKLYEIRVQSDGRYEKLRELTANYKYDENSYVQSGITNWSHTIDLNVPDSTSLLLEYSYKASGNRDVKHNVSNTCTISGVGQGNLEGDTKVEIEVKEATAQADTTGVMLYKVDANSDGIFLENAKFNIYIWNEEQGKYIIVHHPNNGDTTFTTDANGMIVLDGSTMREDQFAYNTAYYIVEIESPTGYYLGPEPYYFYIKQNDTVKYPPCIPDDFTGRALTSGDIIYRQNVSEFTEITVEKYWKDYGGKTVTVTGEEVTSVTLELWQMLQGDPNSAKKFGTYTMTPDENGKWSLTITGLPKATKNADGTRGTNYLYYVKEVRVGGYTLESAENNSGINYGTIQLVNKETEGYILPETGGAGTQMYTTAGLLLMLTSAAFLVYIHTKRRREAP